MVGVWLDNHNTHAGDWGVRQERAHKQQQALEACHLKGRAGWHLWAFGCGGSFKLVSATTHRGLQTDYWLATPMHAQMSIRVACVFMNRAGGKPPPV